MYDKNNLTAFQIYKIITKELGILFPLMEKEIVVRKNPIPNNLEFHKKNISKIELSNNMDEISHIYYKIFKDVGEDKFYEYHSMKSIFNEKPREYPDRKVNLSTVLSILFLSGFRDKELYNRGITYLKQNC